MKDGFQFLIYQSVSENVMVNAVIKDETIWLNQLAMAELFGCSADNVSLHLKNIYAEKELDETATTKEFSVVQQEGARQIQRKKDSIIFEYSSRPMLRVKEFEKIFENYCKE